MSTDHAHGTQSLRDGKGPSGISAEENTDGDRCSYEERRNRRVATLREMMMPLEVASKNW